MKQEEREKLADQLLNIDEDLIRIADSVDDPQKLKAYMKRNRKSGIALHISLPAVKRIAAVAAIVALVAGLFFLPRPTPDSQTPILQAPTIPSFRPPDMPAPTTDPPQAPSDPVTPTLPPSQLMPPPLPWNSISDVEIKSIDMLNYYSAMTLLSTKGFNFKTGKSTSYSGRLKNTEPPENTAPPDTTAPPEGEQPPVIPPTLPSYYDRYEFQPDQTFYVSRVVYFRLLLTVPDGFLASKVGTGLVEVVITDNSFEPMITFKNGDRYYSCLSIGAGANDANFTTYHATFSAHKYIDGFACVKDSKYEDHRFYVNFDTSGQITSFEIPFDPNADPQNAQIPLVGMTFICPVGASFTIQEIENYFNNGQLPDNLITGLGL